MLTLSRLPYIEHLIQLQHPYCDLTAYRTGRLANLTEGELSRHIIQTSFDQWEDLPGQVMIRQLRYKPMSLEVMVVEEFVEGFAGIAVTSAGVRANPVEAADVGAVPSALAGPPEM